MIGPLFINLLLKLFSILGKDGNSLIYETGLYFQQDEAPAYYVLTLRQCLEYECLPKWMRRRGLIGLPARSLDLSPRNFFGFIYTHCTRQLHYLKYIVERVSEIFRDIQRYY